MNLEQLPVRFTNAPRATLLNVTPHPIETVYISWLQSRTELKVPTPAALAKQCKEDADVREEVYSTFRKIVAMRAPILESISITWLMEDIPVALREQIVRHRIGHKFSDDLGLDIIPDFASSSFWSQTSRIRDLSNFAKDGRYFTPKTLAGVELELPEHEERVPGQDEDDKPEKVAADAYYAMCMEIIADMYATLMKGGVHVEDARMLLPLAATHRFTWTMSLQAAIGILTKRTCWLAQLGVWGSIIECFGRELTEKVHYLIGENLVAPPCINTEKDEQDGVPASTVFDQMVEPACFERCMYCVENQNRVNGSDPGVPCPLYLHHHEKDAKDSKNLKSAEGFEDKAWTYTEVPPPKGAPDPERPMTTWKPAKHHIPSFPEMLRDFARLWWRNPFTGRRINKVARDQCADAMPAQGPKRS